MDKEKEIEEMRLIMSKNTPAFLPTTNEMLLKTATKLRNAGYGNIKEARKETAMEIFELLRFGYEIPIDDIAKEVLKGYGVEVDE